MDGSARPEKLIKALGAFFSQRCGTQDQILAVYLFGSRASGRGLPASDIDVGFLFRPQEYVRDRMEALRIAETLGQEISEALEIPVDVTILNSCRLGFIHEVLQTGIPVYDPDPGGRICFEVFVENEYHDFGPFPEEVNRAETRTTTSGTAN